MEDLLATLNRITAYTSEHCFVRFCWRYLGEVMYCKEVDKWDAAKRSQFICTSGFLIEGVRAVFIMRDALIRNNEIELTSSLISLLNEHLTWLDEFSTVLDLNDLNEMLDECVQCLINADADYWETVTIELVASFLKMFFLSVHSLNMSERIELVKNSITL